MTRPSLIFLGQMVLLLVVSLQATAATEKESFDESQRLTAVDLVVGFDQDGFDDWATDPAPLFPDPEDFELLVDGRRQAIVSVGAEEPWDVAVYFQTERTQTTHLRRSALELADLAEAITRLGPVTLVVADPRPVVVLSQSSDAQKIRTILGELSTSLEGRDEIVGLRDEVRQEIRRIEGGEGTTGMSATELVTAAIAEEGRLVRSGNDQLITWLADHAATAAQKLVILVDGGYDLDPSATWSDLELPDLTGFRSLETETTEVAQVLASYGWTVLGLDPEPEEPLQPGWTIGKWRYKSYEGTLQTRMDPRSGEEVDTTFFGWIFKRESHRKPKRAEAFLELGIVHLESDEPGKAAEALRQSLYHFAGHEKTSDLQAVALLHLGEALRQLGDPQASRVAFRLGRALDPDVLQQHLGPSPDLRGPLSPLQRLLDGTGGRLAAGRSEVAGILEELRHRLRLTYQLTGIPDGRTFPVEVTISGPWREAVHPLWARHSTPEALAEARLRRATGDEILDGPLSLMLRRGSDGRIEMRLPVVSLVEEEKAASELAVRFRISIAERKGSGEEDLEIHHHLEPLARLTPNEDWASSLETSDGPIAVLVEDLLTGRWGVATLSDPAVSR